MVNGLHAILYSTDAVATRAFLRDVLKLNSVDAGGGWLIFASPPAELAAHPSDGQATPSHQLFLMCDDIHKTVADLKASGVEFTAPITDQGWGLLTTLTVPGAGPLGLYQPRHPRPQP